MRNALIQRPPWAYPVHFRAMNRLFDDLLDGRASRPVPESSEAVWSPAVDVEENETGVTVRADVPGVAPENIKVAVEGNVLTIEGERCVENEGAEGKTHWHERSSGAFQRRLRLPERVDGGSVTARYDHGVLEVTCPLRAEAKPRKIDVQAD